MAIRTVVAQLLVTLACGVPACANAQKDDALLLAKNMPAVQLWTDAQMTAAYKPYFDCYSQSVETGPGSMLRDDDEVLKAAQHAEKLCTAQKERATDLARSYINSVKPHLSAQERRDLLLRYRRQMGLLSLTDRYRERGRSQLLQAYFERIGGAARQGKPFAMLYAE